MMMDDEDRSESDCVVSSMHVSEQREVELRLHESEERYRVMFELAAVGIAHVSIDGRWLLVNPKLCDIVGYTRAELLQSTFQDMTYAADLETDLEYVRRLLQGELQTYALEKRYVRKDGSLIWINLTVSLVRDSKGEPQYFISIIEDINERKRVEAEANQRQALAHRTQEALEGMLSMAEALVRLPESSDDIDEIGRPLAELTCSVLGCERVGIYIVEPEREIVRPLVVVGLTPEQERIWWEEQRQQENSLNTAAMPDLVERLHANEVVIIDMAQAPFSEQPNPYHIKVMLLAPMCIEERLVGLLTLDYGGEVAHTFTASELALTSAVAKLSALVIERQRLLSERAEAQGREMALREAKSRMEEFLGVASHELRTPLTTIKASVQLAVRRLRSFTDRESFDPEEIYHKVNVMYDMLTRAERQVSVLNRLVDDIVDISLIQAGKLQIELRREPCDLASLVLKVVQEQRDVAVGRSILLEMPTKRALFVLADPDRIAQVVANCVNNALKYSDATEPVIVSLEYNELFARVSVRDHGPGLSAADMEHVWECFYQAPDVKVLSGSGSGLGLGLYISQMIIARHAGQVGVQSTLGEGATFWFTLPIILGE